MSECIRVHINRGHTGSNKSNRTQISFYDFYLSAYGHICVIPRTGGEINSPTLYQAVNTLHCACVPNFDISMLMSLQPGLRQKNNNKKHCNHSHIDAEYFDPSDSQ